MGTAADTADIFPETSMPNTPHGRNEASTGRARIQLPTTKNAKIKYFRHFSTRSSCAGTLNLPRMVFWERYAASSCIMPKEQRKLQKKRPHNAVIKNTVITMISCADSPAAEKFPCKITEHISPTAENTVTNSPGNSRNAASCMIWRNICVAERCFLFMIGFPPSIHRYSLKKLWKLYEIKHAVSRFHEQPLVKQTT